jgi:hypothetical protein
LGVTWKRRQHEFPDAVGASCSAKHLNRLAALVLRPEAPSRAPAARALVRLQAQALLVRLKAALKRPGLDAPNPRPLRRQRRLAEQALKRADSRFGI